MTVSSQVSSVDYDGDGVTVAFAIPFQFFDNADIQVSSRNAAGDPTVLSTGFAITGAGTATRFCTFDTAPANTVHLVIERAPQLLQQTDYVQNDRFPAATNEDDQDRQVMIAQHLYRLLQGSVRFPAGDASIGSLSELPAASTRKNKYLTFDSLGRLSLAAALASETLSQVTIGEFFYPRSASELAQLVVPVNFFKNYGDVNRYADNVTPGTTDMSAAFAAACKCGYTVRAPAGSYKITNVAIASDDVKIVGDGDATILTVGANNSNLFNVTGQNFHIAKTKWVGDGTSNASNNGVGVYLNNAGGSIFEDVYWTGFGFGGISGVAATAFKGPQIIRPKARLTGALGNEIWLGGIWVGTLVQDADFYSTTADRCLTMYDNSTTGWQGVTVRGGGALGYLKQQWATTDEHWDGSDRVWTALFDGVWCRGSNWSAIKCKTSKNVKIVNCTFDFCGLAQEDQVSGLYGDVLCNSLGKVEILNNTFRNSGSAAIRAVAPGVFQYPGSNPGGKASDSWLVSGNIIDTTGVVFSAQGDGIGVLNGFKGAIVTDNILRGITRYGIMAIQTALTPFWDLGIFDNTITDCGQTSQAINVAFGQSLRMDGNLIQNCGATQVVISDVQSVTVGQGDTVLDAGAAGGYGYQIGNADDVDFRARVGNSTYTQWVALTVTTLGTRVYNGLHVYECVVAGTTGNSGGPVHTSGGALDPGSAACIWYYVGNYQLLAYGVRLVGTQGKVNLDFDPQGCLTGPIALLVMGSGGTRIHYTTSIATANATPVNAQVIPIPDLSAWLCEMKVLAQSAAGADHAMYQKSGLFYRAGAGTTLETAGTGLTTVVSVESNAAWQAIPAASGNNLVPAQVTGAAATAINWKVEVTMLGMP